MEKSFDIFDELQDSWDGNRWVGSMPGEQDKCMRNLLSRGRKERQELLETIAHLASQVRNLADREAPRG